MKKLFAISVLVLLTLLSMTLVVSCAAPTPQPIPTPAPAPAPAPTPAPPVTPAPTPETKPSRPPLKIGETIYSHDFSFTPVEVGYTELLINGPFAGNTFEAFKPIEGYKFVYLRMVVQNEGVERAEPPLYSRRGEFKVEVDKGYIYQEINQIANLSWADVKRWVGSADQEQRRAYPCSNHLVFDLNPEEQEELVVAFEILENTLPIEVSFRLFASPEFASEYGIETIIIPIETLTATPTPTPTPAPFPIPGQEELEVHFIDVGQGDAILIDLGEIEVLIDGGDKSPGVVNYLKNHVDGALEMMIATHPHADHIGGLIDVLAKFEVKQIWHNGDTATSKTYSDFMSAVNAENAQVGVATRGNIIETNGLSFKVLSPSNLKGTTNNNSIVLYLAYGEIDFLFTGDAEKEAEGSMLIMSDIPVPDVEILKVGHHASKTASSYDFLSITTPEIAVYMAGEGNSYGHPHAETIQALSVVAAEIYGTDVHGTIIVTTDGETYGLQLEKQAPAVTVTTEPSPPSEKPEQPTPTPPPEPERAISVQITRIFYDGQVPRVESDEYVEITNLGTEPVDLTGWVLKDISEGYPSFTFPSYMLQPGKSVRVYTNEIHPEHGGFSFGSGKAVWNNSDPDTAALYNTQGQEVSRKSY